MHRITLGDLLRHLYQQVIEQQTRNDTRSLQGISAALDQLLDAAEQCGDTDCLVLLHDLVYLANEMASGTPNTAAYLLPSIASRIAMFDTPFPAQEYRPDDNEEQGI
jgi:hypothetical protein